jgi:hypothetical protein
VTKVKPDAETLLTLPMEPPAAGPDRALEPPPPAAERPAKAPEGAPCAVVVEGVVPVAELDIPP